MKEKNEKSGIGDLIIGAAGIAGTIAADVWVSAALAAICPPAGVASWIGMHLIGGIAAEEAGNYAAKWVKSGVEMVRIFRRKPEVKEEDNSQETEAD